MTDAAARASLPGPRPLACASSLARARPLACARWLPRTLAAAWRALRTLSGDDAYERYLEHWRRHPGSGATAPLDRATFFRDEQRRKWSGVKRCC